MRSTTDSDFEAAFDRYLAGLVPEVPEEDEGERPTWFVREEDGSLRPLDSALVT